ncbi:metallophosphoesterase [Daejeonella sp.]|uniref:metallophosphoesterase n=1 Tax=Daejeonella sp. TaxID=2805397 RepID=UPI0030BA2C8A
MQKVTRRKFIVGGLGLITSLIALDAFWYEKFFIEMNEFYLGNATASTKNIKLLQISDLHLQSVDKKLITLVREINKIKPDLILLTGDMLDRNENLHKLDHFLSLFDPTIQKTSILGNWECWRVHPRELLKIYDKHQCELIVNHSYKYTFGETTISVSGMDDFIGGRADFKVAMESYTPAKYHVVMSHCPQHRDIIQKEMKDIPIDLVLSGHTHGGQVNLFGFAPFRPPGSGSYVSGWYRESLPHMYVSRGIGTTVVPVRLGSRAEVTIFNLQA